MAFRSKKRSRKRARARNRFGHFVKKLFRRKARAKRRSSRRRRSNPMRVLMANPRRRRSSRRGVALMLAPKRRRRRGHARLRANPRRRGRIRRRSNPMRLNLGSAMSVIRALAFGGAGIMAARVGAFAYTKYLADAVKGDAGKKDPKSFRALLSEVARIAAMGVTVVGIERGLRQVPMVAKPNDRQVFLYAGLGETGRQAIGLAVKTLKPAAALERYGLAGAFSEYAQLESGQIVGLDENGRWVPTGLVDSSTFAGLVDDSTFEGLVDESSFEGVDDDDDDDDGSDLM